MDAPPEADTRALELAVERLVAEAGPALVVAAPLGLGKPHRLLNALYRRVEGDPSLSLRILTALSLDPPEGDSELARRFLGPFVERFYGTDFERLDYVRARLANRLPDHIEVEEFYLSSGSLLGSRRAQRSHANVNYTHVARGVARQGIGALVQRVAREPGGQRLSLSSNPDLSFDLLDEIERIGAARPLLVAEVDPHLPWIGGTAAVEPGFYDLVLEPPSPAPRLFALPREPIGDADYAIGLYASALVRDGGTLQIGIGALSDALAQALVLRHTRNAEYLELLESLEPGFAASLLVREIGGTEPFARGLYGASEMVNDAFRVLRGAGVLKRRVVDDVELMERVVAGRASPEDEARLAEGHFLDGAFFLGSVDLYEWLRHPPSEDVGGVGMTRVSHINQLYGGHERLDRLQRLDARFFNTCMLVTALGAAAADTLEDGRVVSGVGGQYNFVAMAHALEDGRSALLFRSTYGEGRRRSSNVRWSYGNLTIPRHLRDLAISEYGVADLRDQSDEACVQAMVAIADEAFQEELLARARTAGKLATDWRLPHDLAPNRPEALAQRLAPMRATGLLPDYPHGCDFDATERRLVKALAWMRSAAARRLGSARLALEALGARSPAYAEELTRMGLEQPHGARERLLARSLRLALRRTDSREKGPGQASEARPSR